MTDDTPLPFDLPSVRRKKLTVDFAGGNQSSNGGVPLLREAERKHGVCLRLAEAMPDRRDPDRIRHAMFEMVMSRVLASGTEVRTVIKHMTKRLRTHWPNSRIVWRGEPPAAPVGPNEARIEVG
jgi:DDE family transposase